MAKVTRKLSGDGVLVELELHEIYHLETALWFYEQESKKNVIDVPDISELRAALKAEM
jgi:hypothetical protein